MPCSVEFKLCFGTEYGQSLKVIGSTPSLGGCSYAAACLYASSCLTSPLPRCTALKRNGVIAGRVMGSCQGAVDELE
jgi:hypothetical protein